MTGFNRTPRVSFLRPATAAPRTGLGASLSIWSLSIGVAAALCASGCDSALADGNASMITPPFGAPNSSGVNPAVPGTTNNPMGQAAPTERSTPASLSTIQNNGPTVDASGAPLPAEMLAPLTMCSTPGPRQIRRLTSAQYRNTLVSVFGGDATVPDAPVLRDPTTLGYTIDADDAVIQDIDADALMGLAEKVGAWATTMNKLAPFTNGCTNNDQNCQQQFIRNLGERISREPMDQPRVDRYRKLFDGAGSFAVGAESVVIAMVQSPYLLYRRELGPTNRNTDSYKLTANEVASELAYFLTNAPPDQALRDAAKNNQLGSQADIDSQAARLLATDAAKDVFGTFVRGWTDVDRLIIKAKSGDVELTPELRNDMLKETELLFDSVLNEGGTIGDLFSAPFAFLNGRLAGFYGIQGVTGDGFQKVDLSSSNRVPGLLGQGSYLSAHALADNSSPVQRAFVVRERFLCNDLPEVPTNLDTNLKPQVAGATSRERYAAHSSQEPCHSCHKLMDPIGFTFENYDGFGRYREMEAGKPVDSTGGVPLMNGRNLASPEVTFPLAGVDELTDYLAQIEDVRACMINNLAYYGYGIANEDKWPSEEKVCTDNFIRQEARNSGNTLKGALMAVLHAPTFTTRVRDAD